MHACGITRSFLPFVRGGGCGISVVQHSNRMDGRKGEKAKRRAPFGCQYACGAVRWSELLAFGFWNGMGCDVMGWDGLVGSCLECLLGDSGY